MTSHCMVVTMQCDAGAVFCCSSESVCLSVRPSHAGILPKWLNVGSVVEFRHLKLAGTQFCRAPCILEAGNTRNGPSCSSPLVMEELQSYSVQRPWPALDLSPKPPPPWAHSVVYSFANSGILLLALHGIIHSVPHNGSGTLVYYGWPIQSDI